jgi:hypothetical protein
VIDGLLWDVGAGRLEAVRARLEAEPALVNATGPHPFWGGHRDRPDMSEALLRRGARVGLAEALMLVDPSWPSHARRWRSTACCTPAPLSRLPTVGGRRRLRR